MKRIDYSFFSQNSNYPSHLTEREILNPFLVLEELFRATNSLGVLKDESWQFVSMVLHRNFYMGYDEPLTLYCTHKKLIKLLEALCLITGLRSTNKDQIKGAKKATFSKTRRYGSLEGILTPTPKEPGHSYETCQYIIEDRSYGEWKEELELWLFGGLEPFGGHFYKYELANYAELYLFIEAAYTIYLHSDNKLSKDEREELKKYITFSINADRPTKLSAQDINDPFETISCSFNFYPEVMALYQDFALCHDLLIKSNHWKTHFDYGILLLIFNDIERIIEAVWLIYKEDNPKEEAHQHADYNRHQLNKKINAKLSHLTASQITFPYLVIIDFFRFKPLNKWKRYLDQWLQYSLSNQPFPEFYNESEEAFNHVLKILEVTYLFQNGHHITYHY